MKRRIVALSLFSSLLLSIGSLTLAFLLFPIFLSFYFSLFRFLRRLVDVKKRRKIRDELKTFLTIFLSRYSRDKDALRTLIEIEEENRGSLGGKVKELITLIKNNVDLGKFQVPEDFHLKMTFLSLLSHFETGTDPSLAMNEIMSDLIFESSQRRKIEASIKIYLILIALGPLFIIPFFSKLAISISEKASLLLGSQITGFLRPISLLWLGLSSLFSSLYLAVSSDFSFEEALEMFLLLLSSSLILFFLITSA